MAGVQDAWLLKAVRGGLGAQIIAATKNWRLQPSVGPDGAPALVNQVILLHDSSDELIDQ